MRNISLNTGKIPYYLSKGLDHKDWYTHEATRLMELLPEFKGLPIIRAFAVTSMTSSIESNVHQAIKALLQMSRGEQFHGFLPTQITYLNMIRAGMDVPGRKIGSFIRALEGDKNAVVVDIWMCHAFEVSREREFKGRTYYYSPSKAEYEAVERYCQHYAWKNDFEPRQFQSMVWAGIKREQGVTKNVSWSDLLVKKRGIFQFI